MNLDNPAPKPHGKDANPMEDLRYRLAYNQAVDNQNLGLALVGGTAAALIGASIWAVVSYLTERQIGFMAIGLGFLVGYAIRATGRGVQRIFGIAGAVLSLLACAIGNLLTIVAVIANKEGMGYFETLAILNFDSSLRIMKAAFNPLDLLFYGLAVYYGYKYSIMEIEPVGSEPVLPQGPTFPTKP